MRMNGPTFRMIKEIKSILATPEQGITVLQDDNDYRHFFAIIQGPAGTCYQGGKFNLQILFPSAYPLQPLKIVFNTKIYHPNIDQVGRISLDILSSNWTPILQIRGILITIRSLLMHPNYNSPRNYAIGQHWQNDRFAAQERARQYTLKYAQ